jgi:hypothetical protein
MPNEKAHASPWGDPIEAEERYVEPELDYEHGEEPPGYDDYQIRLAEEQDERSLDAWEEKYTEIEKLDRWAATNDSKFGLRVVAGAGGVITWGPETTTLEGRQVSRAVFWDPKAESLRAVMFSGALSEWARWELSAGKPFEVRCGLEQRAGVGETRTWDIWAESAGLRVEGYTWKAVRDGMPSPLSIPPPPDGRIAAAFAGPERVEPLIRLKSSEVQAEARHYPKSFEEAVSERLGRCQVGPAPTEAQEQALAWMPWGWRELGVSSGADLKLPRSLGRAVGAWCMSKGLPVRFSEPPLGVGLGRPAAPAVRLSARVLWTPEKKTTLTNEPYVRVYMRTPEGQGVTAVFWGSDMAKLPPLDGRSQVLLEGEPRALAPERGGQGAWLEIQRPRLELVKSAALQFGSQREVDRAAAGPER